MENNKKFDAKKMLALNGYNTKKPYLINLINRTYDKIKRTDKKTLYLGAGIISLLALIGYGNCHRNDKPKLSQKPTLEQSVFAQKPAVVQTSGFIFDESPNHVNNRKTTIDTIVLHTTEGSGEGARAWLKNQKSKASAHYLVMEDGLLVQLVKDEDVAWHCRDYNSCSIGIEIAGSYKTPINEKQEQTVLNLTKKLMQKYNLPITSIKAHSELDPSRRSDPGKENMKLILDGLNEEKKTGSLDNKIENINPAENSEFIYAMVTAYDPNCKKCCEKWAGKPTPIGDDASILDGVAGADPRKYANALPFRTKLRFPNGDIYEIDDCGGGMNKSLKNGWVDNNGNKGKYHFDLRVKTHKEALEWGRQYLYLQVIPNKKTLNLQANLNKPNKTN